MKPSAPTAVHGIPESMLRDAVPIESVTRWPGNPREHDIEALRESLAKYGQPKQVLVQQSSGYIFAGNGIHEAAEAEGWTHIARTVLDWPDLRCREYLLDDNALHERGSDPFEAVAQFLADIVGEGGSVVGFEQRQIDKFLSSLTLPASDDVPELDDSDVWVKRGDIFALGNHRLMCGDSANADDVARLMDGELAAVVMADPPYNVNYRGGSSAKTRVRADAYDDEFADYGGWLTDILKNGHAASDERAPLLLWHSSSELRAILAAVDAARWVDRSLIVWNKGSIKGGLGQTGKQYRTQFEPLLYCHKKGRTPRWHGPGNESDVWDMPGPSASPLHPTMKPVALYERCLTNHSPGNAIVLELFSGSGTTIMASDRLGRRARGMEISPRYAQISLIRWQEATSEKAVKL